MNGRSLFLPVAGAFVAAVTIAVIAVPLSLRDRLPEPLASHWGPSGQADRAWSFWSSLAVQVAMWAACACFAMYYARRPGARRQKAQRKAVGAVLGGGAAFVLGMQWITLAANLDRPDWHAAGPIGWQVIAVIAAALAGGVLGRLAASPGPDEMPVQAAPRRTLRMAKGQRAVWVSSAFNPWGVVVAAAGLAGALVVAAVGLTVRPDGLTIMAGTLGIIGVVGLAVSRVGVRAGDDGVVISFGPLGRPSRKIPIDRIQSATVEDRSPLQSGGWGVRGLPGKWTIMIRGGECLVLNYRSGGRLAITVDDAERGATLINTLVTAKAATPHP